MRKSLLPMIALAAVAIVPACSTQPDREVAAIENLTTVCESIAGAVRTLTLARANAQLTAGQIALIDELEPVAKAACSVPPPLDTVTALQRAKAALAQMSAIAAYQGRS
jgi:hypothetical protein